jgi:hypothetical protein
MGRTSNSGLTGNKKGEKGVKTPTGARKRVKLTPPDSSSTIASSQSDEPSQETLSDSFGDSSVSSTITSTISIRETKGQSGEVFIDQRLDFRSFGRKTWEDWVSSGLADHFKRQFQRFQQASTPRAAEKVLVRIEELPLSYRGHQYLTEKVKMVRKLLFLIEGAFSSDERVCRVSEWSAGVAFGEMFSDKILRGWTLGFIHNSGFFSNVAYKRRSGASVIHDSGARLEMTAWLNTASRAKPPAKAKDFMNYINASFNSNIKERTAMVWLHLLGFRYKCSSSVEIYLDGHQRPDVLAALEVYVAEMVDLQEYQCLYTGSRMQREQPGSRLVDPTAQRVVVSWHDECCCHASDSERRRWMKVGSGGKMSDKSRGAARMVAGYCCSEMGLWRESLQFINPGKNKDGWWDGEDTQAQAQVHLDEFDRARPGCICCDIYDNSSGHNCKAKDGLDVSALNLGVGGKNKFIMRNGAHLGEEQSMFFCVGDKLLLPLTADSVQNSSRIRAGDRAWSGARAARSCEGGLPGSAGAWSAIWSALCPNRTLIRTYMIVKCITEQNRADKGDIR